MLSHTSSAEGKGLEKVESCACTSYMHSRGQVRALYLGKDANAERSDGDGARGVGNTLEAKLDGCNGVLEQVCAG